MAACGAFTVEGKRRAYPIAVARRFRDVVRSRRAGHRRGGVASGDSLRLYSSDRRASRNRRSFNNRRGFYRCGNRRDFNVGGFFRYNDRLLNDGVVSGLQRNHFSFCNHRSSGFISNDRFFDNGSFFNDRRFNLSGFYDRLADSLCYGGFSHDGFSNHGWGNGFGDLFGGDYRRDDWLDAGCFLNLYLFLLLILRARNRVTDPCFT